MKLKYIIFALLGLIGVGYSNQDLEEKYTEAGQVQVTAGIAKSRVSFNEADSLTYAYWQTGDAITLSTPTQGNLNYIATVSEDDATIATLAPEEGSLKDIANETVYACYPAATITDGVVTLPATNKWTDTQPLPFAYAVSNISDSKVDLNFEHAFAFLKLTISAKSLENVADIDGDKSVSGISVKSATESLGIISGSFNFEDKSVSITEGSNEVKFTLGTAFNPSEETERSVYIPILPQSGDVAITISLLQDNEGENVLLEMEKQTPLNGFVAGNIYSLTLFGDSSAPAENSSAVINGDSGVIYLAEAGILSNYITDDNKFAIKSLKISGFLNGDDIRLLREMSGIDINGYETDGNLTEIDFSEVTIVEGGDYYYENAAAEAWFYCYTENNYWGGYFFSGTAESKIKKIVLPENVTGIGSCAFEWCSSLENIIMSEGVTKIGSMAFYHCESLVDITIPESVTKINYGAFWDCGLSSVSIPNKLSIIDEYVFYKCESLKKVIIGTNIASIGAGAFASSPIEEFICYAVTPPLIQTDEYSAAFSESIIDVAAARLYVPKGSLTAYQESDWATYFGNIIEMEE